MNGVFYLDVYIGINLLTDVFLLYVTGKVRGKQVRMIRLVLAALMGTAWSCLTVFCRAFPVWTEQLMTWLPVGAGMVFLAYREKRMKDLCATLMTLWLVTAAAGGVFYAWIGSGTLSWIALVLWLSGGWFSFCLLRPVFARWFAKQHLYQVVLSYRSKTKTVTALWDTGNRLYEPYGHHPVHVVSYEACCDLVNIEEGMILIPYHSVGKDNGLLPGVQLDEMRVEQDGEIISIYEKPWIAISRQPLSVNREYQMLLHGEK